MPAKAEKKLANTPGMGLEQFIALSPLAIIQLDDDGIIINANEAFHRLTQDKIPADSNAKLVDYIIENDRDVLTQLLSQAVNRENPSMPQSFTITLDDSHSIIVLAYATCMAPEGNDDNELILHLIDQTEQKNLELRFAHSQKMQAVGQLAGGVAHDFNNLLTAMIGFCDLLLMRHPAGDPSFADIMQIKQNANRAANLVRQLLAFSRRQTLQPKVIDLTDVLAEISNLIRRLIGENIELNMVHGRDLGMVKADQGQLEQVIINLAVNARDAMNDGGSLTIRTSNVTISGPRDLPSRLITPTEEDVIQPGEYVLVEVEDTGTGIPPEIISNIFEPFFSTKEVGSGTGLGLSTVYGIIKQTEGYVYVDSRPNKGTNFHLYFKRHEKQATTEEAHDDESRATDLTGKATVLLVEDETPVRIFAARALGNKGYVVLEADCGETAIEVFDNHDGHIDVIITDVIMPGMNGPAMVTEMEKQFPDRLKDTEVIFISGYAEDAFVDSFGADREFNFLPKPFTLKQLAAKVKEVTQAKNTG